MASSVAASREPSNSWKKTPARPAPASAGTASRALPTSPTAAVPAAAAARAARRAASQRCSAEKAATSRPTCIAQEGRPSPPRKRPASTDSSRWVWAFTSPGNSAPCARSSGSEANVRLISARGPTATMVPAPSTTTAASAIAGLAMGKTQGAPMSRAGFERGTMRCLAQGRDAGWTSTPLRAIENS